MEPSISRYVMLHNYVSMPGRRRYLGGHEGSFLQVMTQRLLCVKTGGNSAVSALGQQHMASCCKLLRLPKYSGSFVSLHSLKSSSSRLCRLPNPDGKAVNFLQPHRRSCCRLRRLPKLSGKLWIWQFERSSNCSLVKLPKLGGKLSSCKQLPRSNHCKLFEQPNAPHRLLKPRHCRRLSRFKLLMLRKSSGSCSIEQALKLSFSRLHISSIPRGHRSNVQRLNCSSRRLLSPLTLTGAISARRCCVSTICSLRLLKLLGTWVKRTQSCKIRCVRVPKAPKDSGRLSRE